MKRCGVVRSVHAGEVRSKFGGGGKPVTCCNCTDTVLFRLNAAVLLPGVSSRFSEPVK